MIGARTFAKHLMRDRCQIGVQGEVQSGPEVIVTYTYGSESLCMFLPNSPKEGNPQSVEGVGNSIDLAEAEIRVPITTSVNAKDRVKVTKVARGNYRETLSTPLVFACLGAPEQHPSWKAIRGIHVPDTSMR